MKINKFINQSTKPKYYIKLMAIIILIFLIIMLTLGLIKYGLSQAYLKEVLEPVFGIVGLLAFIIIIPWLIGLIIMGKIKSYWYYLIVGGIISMAYNSWAFFSNKKLGQEIADQSWWLLVFINLIFIYLIFRQLFGKTKAIEGVVYERDEREKALTNQATKNASLGTIVLLLTLGVFLVQFSSRSITVNQVGYIINFIISVFFIIFAGSLLKYKVY